MPHKDLGIRALRFLDQQGLGPTPDHYNLAYLYVANSDPMLARAIDAIVMSGAPLGEQDALDLMRKRALAMEGQAAGPAAGDEIRLQVLRLADLSADTARATGDFSRELAENVDRMDAAPDGGALRELVSAMVERTSAAEAKLREASDEASRLRTELESARSDSLQDALTGLANRRAVDREFDRLGKARTTARWTIAICDIDHFKRVNDRFGHAVGDRVLKAVATTLRDACAPHMVARWGGEEFVIILEGIEPNEALRIVDAARYAVGDRRMRLRESDEPLGRITISVGLTQARDESPQTSFGRADKYLYRAKSEGRDRICCVE